MIQKPQNWENVQEFSDLQALPLGAYVCKVRSAKVESNTFGSQLLIAFDIDEGDHAGYFGKQFAASTVQGKKWKGVLRQWLPKDNGDERDENTKRSLKGLVTSFEKSNPGYRWNWDETTLAGKVIGILFRKEEYEVENRRGWSVRPFRAMSADRVRSGDYTLPEDRPLRSDAAEPAWATSSYSAPVAAAAPAPVQQSMNTYTPVGDDELPF